MPMCMRPSLSITTSSLGAAWLTLVTAAKSMSFEAIFWVLDALADIGADLAELIVAKEKTVSCRRSVAIALRTGT